MYTFLASLFIIFTLSPLLTISTNNFLQKGSSLKVEGSTVLLSTNGTFSCGFYKVGNNAFTFSIWFTKSADKTVIWCANPSKPVNGIGSQVILRKDGNMVLMDYDGEIIWSTNTNSPTVRHAEIQENGNLVVIDDNSQKLWQSFDYPTDTLLPNQPITSNAILVAYKMPYSSYYYKFYFDDNYVLSLRYESPKISTIYWPDPESNQRGNNRIYFSTKRKGSFNVNGTFTSSDGLRFEASDLGLGIWRRLTLDHDGNLRFYSLNELEGSWSVSWIAVPQHCRVHGFCGENAICMYAPEPTCTCPPGFKMNDLSNWTNGCSNMFNVTQTENPKELQFL